MKLAALILSVYFILFSAQPVLSAVAKMKGCETSCCEKKASAHHSHQKQNSPGTDNEKCPVCNCNIFQCAFCTGVINEEPSFKISLFAGIAAIFSQVNQQINSSHLSDCWQPPELV